MLNPVLDTMLELQKRSLDDVTRNWKRLAATPKVIEAAREVEVGTTPKDVVIDHPMFKLYHYKNEHRLEYAEPILVCYALVNRAYILDLQPSRSVIRQLLRRGFDVYMIDWTVPRTIDKNLRLANYVLDFLMQNVDFVRKQSGMDRINLLGYCMGGAMSSMFTALHQEKIKNLILLAAPIDFAGKDNLLHLWTDEKSFDVDALIDAHGNVPADFLQESFRIMKPMQNYVEKYISFFENADDAGFVENFLAMEKWGTDNVPVAGETFREFVKCLYQKNQLVKGEFRLNGKPVRLERITCPLLLLAATGDHLVSARSTFGIEPHVSSPEVKKMTINAGHVGLVVSSKAHKSFWPEATHWIADHSTPRVKE